MTTAPPQIEPDEVPYHAIRQANSFSDFEQS